MFKKIVVFLVIPLMLAAFVAQAAPLQATCSGGGCNGLNPHTTGCDQSTTTWESRSISNGHIELRFSWICETLWARTRNENGWHYAQSTLAYYMFWDSYNYPWYHTNSRAPIAPGRSVYTPMRYDPVPDPYWNACGSLTNYYIGGAVLWPCTSRQ